MEYYDIVNFEFNNPKNYGFSKVFTLGKDIFEYKVQTRKPKIPAILTSTDPEILRKNMRYFQILHLPTFEANVALISAAAKKGKIFEIPLSSFLFHAGYQKSRMISRIRRFVKFCNSYKADFIFTSRASSITEIRTPREIGTIGTIFDISEDQAKDSLSKLGRILRRINIRDNTKG